MIARIWHGWTTFQNATVYENLLKNEVFPSIEKKKVPGYKKISLLKRSHEKEVEFITVMIFDDLGAVKIFAGSDFEKSYVPDNARKILAHHDETSQHYEIIEERVY